MTSDAFQEAVKSRYIFYKPLDVLPFSQSALLDDKVLEVKIDGLTRVYFSRRCDDLPPLDEFEEEYENED